MATMRLFNEPGKDAGYAEWDDEKHDGLFRYVDHYGMSVEVKSHRRWERGLTVSVDSNDAPETGFALTYEAAERLHVFLSAYLADRQGDET